MTKFLGMRKRAGQGVGCVPPVSVCGGNFKLTKKFLARIRRVAAVAMLHTFWRLPARLPKSYEMEKREAAREGGGGEGKTTTKRCGSCGLLVIFRSRRSPYELFEFYATNHLQNINSKRAATSARQGKSRIENCAVRGEEEGGW